MFLKIRFLVFVFLILAFKTNAQHLHTTYLEAVLRNDKHDNNQAIIYGDFIQRIGFSSGGLAQDIRIINIKTKEILSFRVKPLFKSAKVNTFCFYIKPGNYKIISYSWAESKWYGAKMFTESIYKNNDLLKAEYAGQTQDDKSGQYSFEIKQNSIYYLGTWNFDTEIVSFSDNKAEQDLRMQEKYTKIDWSQAKGEIPK